MEDNKEDILVSIRCLVYNHEPYLRQCLDGFVMQKTNFKFEAIVHDDVSTDNSAEIIREYAAKYPEIIKPIYETENQFSRGGDYLDKIVNNACRGKYIAICEGDDYWIDPYKLQKQVDLLENSNFSICTHGYIIKYSNDTLFNSVIKKYFCRHNRNPFCIKEYANVYKFNRDDNLRYWITQPLSVLFKRELLDNNPYVSCKLYRDIHMFYHILSHGDGLYIDEMMGVYNKHENGVFSGISKHRQYEINACIYKELFEYNRTDLLLLKNYFLCLLITCSFSSMVPNLKKIFCSELSLQVKFNVIIKSILFRLKMNIVNILN